MSTDLSKQEYLKRYLEKDKGGEKKKRKKLKSSNSLMSRMKILDQNIDLKSIMFGEKDLDDDEDEPLIAEIIDERPLEVKVKELYDASRWKKVGSDAGATDTRKIHANDAISKKYSKNEDDHDPPDNFLLSRKKTIREKKRHDSDSDISLPRRNSERNTDSDISPPRSHHKGIKKSKNSVKYVPKSPSVKNYHEDISLRKVLKEKTMSQRKSKNDSDSDISISQKHVERRRNDSNCEIVVEETHISSLKVHEKKLQRKSRHDSDSDISPPRNQHSAFSRKNSDSDISPPRNQHSSSSRKNSDSDISPPRDQHSVIKREKKDPPRDISSPKLKRKVSNKSHYDSESDDCNIERKIKHFNSENFGKAIIKKERHHNPDFSPSRPKSTRNMEESLSKGEKNRPKKTLLGLKAGLQDASTLRIETQELREREKRHINKMSDNLSGRNVQTIVRDHQTGMKRDLQAEQLVKDAEEKKTADHQKKYMEWGKGVEQTENRQKKLEDDLYEMSKPLARYCDDEDLEERLKSAIHEEDPMAEYMRKKRRKNEPALPVYCGPAPPPNRFGILPGYRWDGVDRSNGFEKKYFEKNNASKATQEEAYLWSVQDM